MKMDTYEFLIWDWHVTFQERNRMHQLEPMDIWPQKYYPKERRTILVLIGLVSAACYINCLKVILHFDSIKQRISTK